MVLEMLHTRSDYYDNYYPLKLSLRNNVCLIKKNSPYIVNSKINLPEKYVHDEAYNAHANKCISFMHISYPQENHGLQVSAFPTVFKKR